MRRYIAQRLVWGIPTILGALTLVFALMFVVPGDPALLILGVETYPNPEALAELRKQLGTDRPMHVQYFSWLGNLLRGDLGIAMRNNVPVVDELKLRLPVTLYMMGMAIPMGIALAIPMGIFSALRQDTWVDYGIRTFAFIGNSLPDFVFGVLLIVFLVSLFSWFPPIEYENFFTNPWVSTQQLLLPALVLGYRRMAVTGRMIRSTLLEVLREDYIRTAQAKGLATNLVVSRHAIKNALLPVITLVGVDFAFLFSGSVVIESVYNVPGVGVYLVGSIIEQDYIGVMGTVAMVAVAVVVVNMLVDTLYAWLDPRIRYR